MLLFLRLVYSMLSVSLDCPLVIALSVFFNVYLHCIKTLFGKSNLKILYEMRDLKKNKDVLLGNGMWRKYDNLKGTLPFSLLMLYKRNS